MRIFGALSTSGSALTAERLRLDLVANNLANLNSTAAPGNQIYQRQFAVLTARGEPLFRFRPGLPGGLIDLSTLDPWNAAGTGVEVSRIWTDTTAPQMRYEPGHPHADEEGMVAYPNVDVVAEMVDMLSATRAYEANVTAFNAGKDMAMRALDIGR